MFGWLNYRAESFALAGVFFSVSLLALLMAHYRKVCSLDRTQKELIIAGVTFGIPVKKHTLAIHPALTLRLSKKALNQSGNLGLSTWVDLDFVESTDGKESVRYFLSEKNTENQAVLESLANDMENQFGLTVEDNR